MFPVFPKLCAATSLQVCRDEPKRAASAGTSLQMYRGFCKIFKVHISFRLNLSKMSKL